MRLATVLAGTAAVLLLAGAAAAATQAHPEAPRLLGTLGVLLGCGDSFDQALLLRDALDEAEFAAAFEPWAEAGP
ncbi:hypothetical protein [Paracraurococcus lichenis]|uniref:Uncharacterized protein n=1 Tax=Paracraurococcus lichenis TaxID=3064888 RepID=A0ABT9E212_9PROT|nr:hypothetical protein [Paracraurococcus sp. LOR1-02]MDO9710197.1 hypothetical protein [Paracraurococcus sp. LOR1-02]